MKEDEIVRHSDRHSNETVTRRKHITKYKNMEKWMDEFLRKFKNRGIKIARLHQINQFTVIYFKFCTVFWVRWDVDILKQLTDSAQSINREVSAWFSILIKYLYDKSKISII